MGKKTLFGKIVAEDPETDLTVVDDYYSNHYWPGLDGDFKEESEKALAALLEELKRVAILAKEGDDESKCRNGKAVLAHIESVEQCLHSNPAFAVTSALFALVASVRSEILSMEDFARDGVSYNKRLEKTHKDARKLTDEQEQEIVDKFNAGTLERGEITAFKKKLATEYNVSLETIYRIIKKYSK